MSNNLITKEALASSFKKLLEYQPISKISVKNITEHCNISRNTFYYHFKDKYELVNWIFYTDMLENVNTFNDSSKLTESFVNVCKCLYTDRKFYRACFQYTGQNSLFTYIYETYYELWKINIDMNYCKHGFKMTENEINLTARLKAHSLVGIISDWVNEGMRDNYMTFFEQIRDILDSEASSYSMLSTDRMLENQLEENADGGREKDMLNNRGYIYSDPESEASHDNSLIPFINYGKPAPERCLDMLLAKYRGDNYQSEVLMNTPEIAVTPQMKKPLSQSTIMLVTDGGLVPRGNPGRIPCANAGCFGVYELRGKDGLQSQDYEVSHQGYENQFVEENPNRLLPVDALWEMERAHAIGRVYDSFLTTAGVMMSTEESVDMAKEIANYIEYLDVDAVIIVSACGTSTRCGAYIGIAIEKLGIPVVQIANLSQIAQSTGVKRVVKGNSISCPFGDPQLAAAEEYDFRKKLLQQALNKLYQ